MRWNVCDPKIKFGSMLTLDPLPPARSLHEAAIFWLIRSASAGVSPDQAALQNITAILSAMVSKDRKVLLVRYLRHPVVLP